MEASEVTDPNSVLKDEATLVDGLVIGVVWVVVGPAELTDPLSVLEDEASSENGLAIGIVWVVV